MDEHIQTSQHMLDTLSSDHARLMERTRMPRFYAVGIGILAGVLDVMWWVIGTAFAGGSLFGLHTTAMLIIALIINTVCLLGVIALILSVRRIRGVGSWSLDRTRYAPRPARQRLLRGIAFAVLLLTVMLGSAALCLFLGCRLTGIVWILPIAIIAGALTAIVQQAGISLTERRTVTEGLA
ncbi:hypothetical protein [Bifidobacterium pullorum]|uniref:hypothetical protein n=1 Tax=Bifidobacterium pullorum TaxID=78448 RepID=UPI000529D8FE|nr:hypothetical protein [Bifidobacterium pullorum]